MSQRSSNNSAALLPFLGVLRVGGSDASRFLQGQLTNDTRLLADGRTQLSALSTPQGRVVALLRLRWHEDAIYALMPQELVEPVCSLLRRYVLRSRVDLRVASELEPGWIAPAEQTPVTGPDACSATHSLRLDGQPGGPTPVLFDYAPGRRVLAAPAAAWRPVEPAVPHESRLHLANAWCAADIADGLPQVGTATSGAFVPQMLNLDLLGGISFTKGCYTGQEIVARTQNLGRIKRRSLRFRVPIGPAPAPLTGLHFEGVKVAEVLTSADCAGGVQLLAVTNLDARSLPLELEDGRVTEPLELPYAVPG
jgi:hypothetical protein